MALILVAGASRGIGLELVRQHLAAGDEVIALVRDPASPGALAELSGSAGLTIGAMDTASDASVQAAADAIGDASPDVVWIVAGIVGKMEPMLEPGDWESFDDSIEIMLKGPLRVARAFLPKLHEGSKIIAFSSQLAASTWPYGGFYPYIAAKAGLGAMFRAMSLDVKDRGIIVGTVHPGWVQTDMGGPGADITVEESASGLRKTAGDWTIENTGAFMKWNGEKHPW